MKFNNFSVVICCFNSEKFINQTINSIINQKYKYWEIIIIDDGSKDKTEEIVNYYINQKIPIKYFKQKNHGHAYSRNRGIEESKYDWIAILDHDDLADSNRLEIHNNQINNDEESKLFFGDCLHKNFNSNYEKKHFQNFILEKYNLSKKNAGLSLLGFGSFIPSSSLVFNKSASKEIGLYNTKYKYIAEYDFFIKMGLNFKISYTKNVLSIWRVHDLQSTKKMYNIYSKELIYLLFNYLIKKEINLIFKILILKRMFLKIIRIIIS